MLAQLKSEHIPGESSGRHVTQQLKQPKTSSLSFILSPMLICQVFHDTQDSNAHANST